ncbi:TonB-dependent receptor [Aquidulcibacter paucihalophilus]|nr:TonB-dependent receptor [Aquidulcibacter paucihalophilus]
MSTTMIGGFAALAFAAPAMAQDAGASQDLDDVIVTGSRIPQANLVTTSPVTQVTGEDIDVAGVTRVEDLISQLPQAFAAQNSTVSNGASGTATVSLRNLGSSRTLVLIDGRRMGYGSPNDPAADLNQVPEQLVERVEVLTGGASAVYGSDAVAGVVNFIMKKDFEGLQIDAQYGFYQHNNNFDGVGNLRSVIADRSATNPAQFALPDDNVSDGESRSVNITLGVSAPDGRGNLLAYAGYRNNNPILQADRDYSGCSIGAPAAATPQSFTCGGSGTSFPGRFTDFGGGPGFNSTLGAGRTFVPFDNALHQYNFGPLNYFQRPDERYTMGAFGRYEVNEKAEVFAQLMFSDYKSVAQIAPSGNFFNTADINCGNPLLGAQQAATIGCTAGDIAADTRRVMYIGRRNVEGGGRQDDLNYTSYRGVVGVRGEIAPGWDYDVAAQFSRVALARTYMNDFSATRLTRALDVVDVGGTPTCRSVVNGTDPTCVPYDIFIIGGVTQAALDYVQIPLIQRGETTQQVVTAAITGDTGWSMPTASRTVQVAFGAEYRRDYLASTTDANFASGDGTGQGGPTIGLSGDADVAEVFGEIQIPLADDQPWAYSASIDAAYRRSEYENISTDTYKVGADYAPVEDLRFRASYSHAVRAPNVIELFSAQGFGLFDADRDPCDATTGAVAANCIGSAPHQVTAGQSASGALNSPAGQYNQLTGGNPNLNPEEADTFTYGVVWTPSFVPGFNLTVDYFDIEVDGLISTVGPLNTIAQCYGTTPDAAACARITRNAGGNLWVGTGVVSDLNENIGGLGTTGWDFNANYAFDLEDMGVANMGSINMSFVGTLLDSHVTDTGLGAANSVYDCAGFYGNQCTDGSTLTTPNPEWRHRARATWLTPWDVDISATWRHYGEVELAVLAADGSLNNGGTRIDRFFDAENYLDLAATWQVMDNVSLRAGVNNVFDDDPQLSLSAGTSGNGNTYPQLYDSQGRYFFFGVTANF